LIRVVGARRCLALKSLDYEAEAENVTSEDIITEILNNIEVP